MPKSQNKAMNQNILVDGKSAKLFQFRSSQIGVYFNAQYLIFFSDTDCVSMYIDNRLKLPNNLFDEKLTAKFKTILTVLIITVVLKPITISITA